MANSANFGRLFQLGGLALVAVAIAGPARAQPAASPAAASSAFDGTYIGTSAQNNSRGNTLAGGRARSNGYAGARSCPTFRAPARLTIAGGEAQAKWGDHVLRGSPAPNGRLRMMTGYGQTFEGQIDNQGMVSGQLVGYCAYALTWRKVR